MWFGAGTTSMGNGGGGIMEGMLPSGGMGSMPGMTNPAAFAGMAPMSGLEGALTNLPGGGNGGMGAGPMTAMGGMGPMEMPAGGEPGSEGNLMGKQFIEGGSQGKAADTLYRDIRRCIIC